MDDMQDAMTGEQPEAQAGPASAMMIDLTPGAITAATMDGEAETFDTIGDLLQYLLDKYRVAETGDVTHGDFLAGYGKQS